MLIFKLNRRTPRGSVMVLVVAVLALLVVIGTVFIVSARAERNTSAAMSTAANLNLARDGAMSVVKQAIGGSMYDSNGNVGGAIGTATSLASRNFDYPEVGTNGVTTYNTSLASEPWLVAKLHAQVAGADLSELTSAGYDPSTGTYSKTFNAATTFNTGSIIFGTVVGDQTVDAVTAINNDGVPSPVVSDAYINVLPFSDASGIRYRYGVRILDLSRMANLNTGSTDDTLYTVPGSRDKNGTYITSYRLTASSVDNPIITRNFFKDSDPTPPTIGNYLHKSQGTTGLGRAGLSANVSSSPFTFSGWQNQIFHMEQPTDAALTLFDLSDELELRSYGEFGTAYRMRPAVSTGSYTMWPATLSSVGAPYTAQTAVGNPSRRNYTTSSVSRELRPYPDPAKALVFSMTPPTPPTPATTIQPWPYAAYSAPSISRVPVNLPLTSAAPTTEDSLAQIATALATAMTYTSNVDFRGPVTDYNGSTPFAAPGDATPAFTQDEVCAFAVNYIESRWNGMIQDPNLPNAYFLPAGPSLIDSQGICVRAANGTTGLFRDCTGDVKATGSKIYLGYAAQPFINEVAITAKITPPATLPVPTEIAVELFNPYNTPLSLNGYFLKIGNQSIPLTGSYVPAHGYFVIAGGAHFDGLIPGTTQKLPPDPNLDTAVNAGATNVALYRPYAPRGTSALSTTNLAEVDKMDFTGLLAPANFTTADADHSWARSNNPALPISTGNWGAAFDSSAALLTTPTLGISNGGTGTFHPLYDRFAGTPEYTTSAAQRSAFVNVAEFNRTMRICHIIDSATNGDSFAGPPFGLVTAHMASIISSTTPTSPAPFCNMQYPIESQLYFDFMARPTIYNSSPANSVAFNSGDPAPGDIRAVRFLDQIAFIDRVSDTSIDIGGGASDINKMRLPGQINVNTASGDVLRAIPNMTNQMVANIIAYRDRKAASIVTYGAGTAEGIKTCSINYSAATYPGLGIRSLAELMVPITDASAPTSFATRDTFWANVYNLCTVRSDSFVVYGYLEAVKRNPNYTTVADDWYSVPSDDPTNAPAGTPLIRVARRRWVAIVDRSYCNYSRTGAQFSLPRVVAIKDLPR